MASGSTSSRSAPLRRSASGCSRRGLTSCLHSLNCRAEDAHLVADQEIGPAMCKLIVGFYDEAFGRLPCETMPHLHGLLATGGFCLGLLDPVSNIILNTIALLPKDDDDASVATSPPTTKTSPRRTTGIVAWLEVATRSYHSLIRFLMAYFGCLTQVQAIRYLYRAGANLPLAVMLVQHDLYVEGEEEAVLEPESDRTQAALKWAATTTGHPSPTILAQLMALRLTSGDLELVKEQFSADGGTCSTNPHLTAEYVRAIQSILQLMMSPMCVANISHTNNGGLVVHVYQNLKATWSVTPHSVATADSMTTSTTFCWDGTPISSVQSGLLPHKLQDCLTLADGQKHILKTPCCGDACDYLQSLKMYLHGMIHNLYVQAFKLMPTPSGSFMRAILKAGHCYGSCDPLSNIILNSIWYDTCGSSQSSADRGKFTQCSDVLDPLSLLRPVVRSLEGLAKLALFADPQSSIARAMERLCSAKCVTVDMLSSASYRERSEKKNPFHEAATAAGHPLPLELGDLHQLLLLMPDWRNELLDIITEAQTTGAVLRVDDIRHRMFARLKGSKKTIVQAPVQAPELCVEALGKVSSKRSAYESEKSWLRSKIEQVLKDYTGRHFWGPTYKLDVIVGVEDSSQGYGEYTRYYINFMATSDPKRQSTLFFAELWSQPNPMAPEFCCPLPYPYAGRCYSDVLSARKIVYPDDAKYIPDDITHGGTERVDNILDMDLVLFSSELDVELAEKLNMLPPPSSGYDSGYDSVDSES